MGQLRLDTRALAMKGGISGPAIIPGKGQESRLMHRILGSGGEARMPMGGDPLTAQQTELVKKWIDEGAKWPGDEGAATQSQTASSGAEKLPSHWAYVVPAHPQPPDVSRASWVRNPIDNFVLARLEREKLAPAAEAAKETLIRRVSLDLIGLPPTPQEVDEFVSDATPNAYEKLVDRLLSSPHYGERWARPWLDMARYADTNGYEKDRRRSIWKYRDWVIDAFNHDMPFDQFTVEQIAGDMLSGATTEQKIATGFHRNAMLNEEGGVDPEEARWETLVDRVGTTATVWLGSTLACAQCHNHKYDPFTQKEFYQFMAFFNNTEYQLIGPADISEQKLVEPKLELPTPEQSERREQLQAELKTLKSSYEAQTTEIAAAQEIWEREVKEATHVWSALRPINLSSSANSSLMAEKDDSIFASGANPEQNTYTIESKINLTGVTGVRLEALADERLPRGGPGRDIYGNFLLNGFSVEVAPAADPSRTERIEFKTAVADDQMRDMRPDNLLKDDRKKGWQIDASREERRLNRQAVFVAAKPFGFVGETFIKIKLTHDSDYAPQALGRFRLSVTTAAEPAAVADIPVRLRPLLGVPAPERTTEQKKQLGDYFRSVTPALKETRDKIASVQRQLDELGIVSTLVMQERSAYERPSVFLRVRGSFTNIGEKVYAAVPASLHAFPESQLPNRLGLARWLVDENNALTPRVTVNRLWEQLFGRGIVETSEDFGMQSSPPTHPELLDWLAAEFVNGKKWSVKGMLRLIVTSATYRQDSRVTPEMHERDQYNKLLARGPRFRLDGEGIRDVALVASNLLNPKIGGPSVFPYQPEGIWSIPYNDDYWRQSEGPDKYRRALYTFWRRTSPYPSLATFDATSREFCTVRRVRTNTPLQALTTLNDPTFFDMARGLARRIITEAVGDARARAAYGFRLCTSRAPQPQEIDQLTKLYEQQSARLKSDRAAVSKLLGDLKTDDEERNTELAAWAVVSNVLLNLDETVTKE